jgi:hypothetical protein
MKTPTRHKDTMKQRNKTASSHKPRRAKARLITQSLTPGQIYDVFRASSDTYDPILDDWIPTELELNPRENGTAEEIYELFLGHRDTPSRELDDWILGELELTSPEYDGLN